MLTVERLGQPLDYAGTRQSWARQLHSLGSREDRSKRVESERFHLFSYDEIAARDKANLDITWLRDDTLEDGSTLPPPAVLAAEIVEELEAALAKPTELAATLPVT